jgi:hypothetical protein
MGRLLRNALARQSNRDLLVLALAADILIFVAGMPLERYSLMAAADKSSTALLIAALLACNIALPLALFFAIVCNTLVINRVVSRFLRKPRFVWVERGEIKVAATAKRDVY